MSDPKAEQWINNAAFDIAYEFDHPGGVVQQEIAEIIARHTPKPEDQPIRRGDVVQFVANCRPKSVGLTFIVEHVVEVDRESHFSGYTGDPADRSMHTGTSDSLARIGRAKFYPDGSKVED